MTNSPTTDANQTPPKRRCLKIFWRIVRAPLIAYVVICLLMACLETSLVYPRPAVRTSPSAEEMGFEDVYFKSADGAKLHGWYHAHSGAAHADSPIGLLYCHGNGEDITHNADLIRFYHDKLSASVFIFDYRGYGQSAGSPDEAGVIADGLAAQRWLADRLEVETDELILVGRSLGGGVAVALAEQQGARALILQNTFASMAEVAADKFPWLPIDLIIRNRYPSVERIQTYTGPLLQVHGTADQVVPFANGKQLFDASPSKQKKFIKIPNGGHNYRLPATYYEALLDFLNEVKKENSKVGRTEESLRRVPANSRIKHRLYVDSKCRNS